MRRAAVELLVGVVLGMVAAHARTVGQVADERVEPRSCASDRGTTGGGCHAGAWCFAASPRYRAVHRVDVRRGE